MWLLTFSGLLTDSYFGEILLEAVLMPWQPRGQNHSLVCIKSNIASQSNEAIIPLFTVQGDSPKLWKERTGNQKCLFSASMVKHWNRLTSKVLMPHACPCSRAMRITALKRSGRSTWPLQALFQLNSSNKSRCTQHCRTARYLNFCCGISQIQHTLTLLAILQCTEVSCSSLKILLNIHVNASLFLRKHKKAAKFTASHVVLAKRSETPTLYLSKTYYRIQGRLGTLSSSVWHTWDGLLQHQQTLSHHFHGSRKFFREKEFTGTSL